MSTYTVIQLALTGVMVVTMVVSVLVWAFFFGGTLTGTMISLIALFILYYALVDIANIVTDTVRCNDGNGQVPDDQPGRSGRSDGVGNRCGPLSHGGRPDWLCLCRFRRGHAAIRLVLHASRQDRMDTTYPLQVVLQVSSPCSVIGHLTALTANLDKVFIGPFGTSERSLTTLRVRHYCPFSYWSVRP